MKSALTILILATSLNTSATEFSVVGGYGFNWLKPKSAKCQPISTKQAATFKKCEFFAKGQSFGLPLSHHTCMGSGRDEYLIYKTKSQCVEAIETMHAHAP